MSPNCFLQIATVICKTCCGTFELARAYTRTNILTVILTRINVGQSETPQSHKHSFVLHTDSK